MRLASRFLAALTVIGLASALAPPSFAQESWSPFGSPETSRLRPAASTVATSPEKPPLAPMDGARPWENSGHPAGAAPGATEHTSLDPPRAAPDAPLRDAPVLPDAVERGDLAPVMSPSGSGLPYELWSGLSASQLEELMARLDIPPRSPVLHDLWRRLITADAPEGAGGNAAQFTALRVEALDRSGLLDEEAAVLAKASGGAADPVIAILLARSEIGRGNTEHGCELARPLARSSVLPGRLKPEAILIAGYCAALAGDMTAAGVNAGLARELGLNDTAGPDALDIIAAGDQPDIAALGKLSPVDDRILELKGGVDPHALLAAATPGLLAVLARSDRTDPALKLAAAEAAAAVNAIPTDDLAALYRALAPANPADQSAATEPALRRAALFSEVEAERAPLRRARLVRTFLDDTRRAGLYRTGLELMARPSADIEPLPEVGWFAETAIETGLMSRDFAHARAWAAFGSSLDQYGQNGLAHWMALIDIADPPPGDDHAQSLASIEHMALGGRFEPELLHRLATVLDALDINVPTPLWDLAGRTPQPSSGHLPETGVLSELADASKKREFARTVLLAMRALGPDGAEGAHIIALGDSIRALKRANLGREAHLLGLEALFATWPRVISD